jgi:carbon-monoxide dehydrogenase iron sulfur subunit
MQKVITINPELCTGCLSCEAACSLKHDGKCGSTYSRIQIQEFREVNVFVPILCQHCEDAPCINVCPTGARMRTGTTGAVVTNEDLCIGCRACVYICPFGAPIIHPETGKAVTCDLCEGESEPWCVRACTMQKALQFVPKEKAPTVKSRAYAKLYMEQLKPSATM